MNRPPQITSIKDTPIRLAEVGKIKIGGKGEERTSKKGGTYRLPVKYDHFVVTGLERTEQGKGDFIADPEVMQVVGPEAKELDVLLLHDDPDMNLQSKLAFYIGKTLWCVGNKEEGYRRNKVEYEKGVELWEELPCPCEFYTGKNPRCKSTFVLSVMLPQSPKVGGVYKFRSTSEISLINLKSAMAFISGATNGILAGIPLRMVLQPQTVTPGDIITKVYVVNLIYPGLISELVSAAADIAEQRKVGFQQTLRLRQQLDRLLLAPPLNETDEDMVEEFFPEGTDVVDGELVEGDGAEPAAAVNPTVDYPKAGDEPEPEPPAEEQPPPANAERTGPVLTDSQRIMILTLAGRVWPADRSDSDQLKVNMRAMLETFLIMLPEGFSLSASKPNALPKALASKTIEKLQEISETAGHPTGLGYQTYEYTDDEAPQEEVGSPPADQTGKDGAPAHSEPSGPKQQVAPSEPSPHPLDPPDPVKVAILQWLAEALNGDDSAVDPNSATFLCDSFRRTHEYVSLEDAEVEELKLLQEGVKKKANTSPRPEKEETPGKQEPLF